MIIQKSKMVTICKPAKPNLLRLVSKWVPEIGFRVISLNSEFQPCSSSNSLYNFLVPFLATREEVAPLANDPIILGRSMWSFRHLESQDLSIISESIE